MIGHKHKTYVQFQERSKPPQDFDSAPATWQDVMPPTLATVVQTAGREVVSGQQILPMVTHLVTMRWQPGVRADWRILLDNPAIAPADQPALNIVSSIDLKLRRRHLVLQCVESPQS